MAKKPATPAKKAPAKKPTAKAAPKKAQPAKPRAHDNKKGADGLTQQQRLFVNAYLASRNATKAATTAGYSEATAQQQGSRLLSNVMVKTAIEQGEAELIAEVQAETGITLKRTLEEIARGAFFDVRNLFRPDGTPKDISELDYDTAAVIAGLDTATESEGKGEDRTLTYIRKYKLADKKGYLDMLMKHLGGYKVDNEQGGKAAASALGQLLQEMGRSALPVVKDPGNE